MKICVIQNGVPDAQGDTLDTSDIKRIFTSFNNQDNFEIHHNNLPISEVSLLENYISTIDEDIAGTNVPKGSWNAVVRVDNPEIKQQLMDGVFGGVSLNNRINESCSTGLVGKYHTYNDLKSAECVIPLFISFVETPSNGVGLHIMDYDKYIQKSSKSNGVKTMSFLDKVKALIQEEEAEVSIQKDATPIDTKEQEAESSDDVKVISKSAVADEPADDNKEETETESESEAVVEKASDKEEEEVDDDSATEEPTEETEVVEEKVEEEVIEKADPTESTETEVVEEVTDETTDAIDFEAKISDLEERIAKLESIIETKAEPTTESEEPVEPVITKSAKIEVTTEPVLKNVYELTGRDPVTGKKIRRQSKVLN